MRKERWIRGTVISQEGSIVNVHVDNAVMRVNQSKISRDHDEWHDVAVPGLDNPDPVPLALEDEEQYEPSIAENAEYALTLLSRLIGSVKLASVMLWNC